MIDFERMTSLPDGRASLAKLLPPGTTRAQVEQTMQESGAKCFEEPGGMLCIWEGSGQIHGKWLVSIAFDSANRLQRLAANYGVVAP